MTNSPMRTNITGQPWGQRYTRSSYITRLLAVCLLLVAVLADSARAADYVLVVDTSGSMREQISAKDNRIRINVVQNALREYLPALPQPSRVDLIAFNSGIVSERELILESDATLRQALTWVDQLEPFTKRDGQTHLWTTLQHALEVATRYSRENPTQPVIVRALTDGLDNEHVTSLEKVLRKFPQVDGEHIRGNLVLLGDLEFKMKLVLPEGAFTTTKSTTWSDIFPPVVLCFPNNPRVGDEVRFFENTRSVYADYEWSVDGQVEGKEKVMLRRFAEARPYRVTLRVKGIQGTRDSTTVTVDVKAKERFTAELVSDASSVVAPGNPIRFWVRCSSLPSRFSWWVNRNAAGSNESLEHTFDSEGSFEVKVAVWSADGTIATNACMLTVKESPLAVHIKAPNQATASQPVQFAADITGPCAKVQWRFGDGATSADKAPIHTFDLKGTLSQDFQVWLRAESPMGRVAEAGPHILRVQARAQIKPPVAAFRVLEQAARAGDALHLLDESQGYVEKWEWRLGGANVANEKNPVIRINEPGSNTLTLVVSGPGGTNEVSKHVVASPRFDSVRLAVAASSLSGTTPLTVHFTNLVSGDVRSWLWEFGDGTTSTNPCPKHTFVNASNYGVTVTAYPADPSQAPVRAQCQVTAARPWPLWAKAAVAACTLASLGGIAGWLGRRRQREKLRLTIFWWPEQSAVCRRADLNDADGIADLNPEARLRIRRIGTSRNLVAEALEGSLIVTGDGQETESMPLGEGARLVVRDGSGAERAVAVAVDRKPLRPAPAAGTFTLPTGDSLSSPASAATKGNFDWGWESTSTTTN